MAKPQSISQSINSILVSFALVFWRKSNNERSDYENTDAISDSLTERGWLPHYNVPVFPILSVDKKGEDGTVTWESDLTVCMKERQARWDALRETAKGSPDAAVELQVFERLYVKDGKLIVPKYSGNAGFRRASAFERAMVARYRRDDVSTDEKILDQVPVIVKSYADEAERIIDQQLENELKDVGTVKMPELDKLRITMKLYRLGKREIFIRRLYKDTTGQKLFNICVSNDNWPELNVFNRFFLDPQEPSQIPYGKVRHNVLIKYNNRYDADVKRSKAEVLKPHERSLEPIKVDEVSRYFNDLRTDSAPAPKIMKKDDIEAGAKQNGVHFFRTVFQSVMDANTSSITPYMDSADQLNLHKKLIDSRQGAVAHLALKLADSAPDAVTALSKALATGKLADIVAVLTPAAPAGNGSTPAGTVPGAPVKS